MFNKDIKIAFFGTSEFSLVVLNELKKLGIMPDIIVTVPDKPQGRKMVLTPTPTKVWAEKNGIEYIEAVKLKDESFLEKMREYDLFMVASYGKMIPKVLIDIPKYKILNIHPSLLPKYRGPSPLQGQVLNDERKVGVSIMLVDEEMDHGAVVIQRQVDIKDWPIGFNALSEILAKEGSLLLSEVLADWIKGKIKAKDQDHAKATFTKKIEKQDGLLDLNADAYKNYLKYLAYEEWPGTFFDAERNGKKIRVIIKKAVWNGTFEIQRVVPEGKKEMGYKDFLRGFSI
ncbi:MAG: methionyl-tRNA formyltransferase [Candidatus Paceibacterota bacterium]|jgi:methionyl-tRNA formyltransferase